MNTVPTAASAASAQASPALPRQAAGAGVRLAALELPLLVLAGMLLVGSIFLPYWNIRLFAPQYPKGLIIETWVNQVTGDVQEVDTLNHYIGMAKVEDAAVVERAVSRVAIPIVALLAVASYWLRGTWRLVARLPIMLYPIIFAADLFSWLYYWGHSLDPLAPLSSSIDEFTPRILGVGYIGQFHTEASFTSGFYVACAAALIVLAVTVLARRWGDAPA